MEIFGIGPFELLLIVLIALIVLGPKEMMKTAQKSATWLRKLRNSEIWSSTKEVMDIPNQVLRETGLDKEIHELQSLSRTSLSTSPWQSVGSQIVREGAIQPVEPESKSAITAGLGSIDSGQSGTTGTIGTNHDN